MPDISEQLSNVFRELGMEPAEIRRNEDLDRWEVSVQADGTDTRYLRDVGEIGGESPIDQQINFAAIKSMRPQIEGTTIPAGTVNVVGFESEYFQITISG